MHVCLRLRLCVHVSYHLRLRVHLRMRVRPRLPLRLRLRLRVRMRELVRLRLCVSLRVCLRLYFTVPFNRQPALVKGQADLPLVQLTMEIIWFSLMGKSILILNWYLKKIRNIRKQICESLTKSLIKDKTVMSL